jgi:hypothetical protein
MFVGEQHDALQRCRPRDRERRGGSGGRERGGIRIRVLEQPELELDAKDPAHRAIDQAFVELAGPDERGQVRDVGVAVHLHVDPGGHRFPRRLAVADRQAVDAQLSHGVPVAHHEAAEVPLVLEDPSDQALVGRCRHAVHFAERRHDGRSTSLDRGAERRQVHVAQFVLAQVGSGIVAAALDGPVAGEMFGAGGDCTGPAEVRPLEAPQHRDAEDAGEVRILAETLRDAPPAWIPANVEHRRKGPVHAACCRFLRRHPARPHDQIGIPGRRLPEWDRHHRLEAMNDIAADQQGNAEATLLDGETLQLVDDPGVDLVQHAAHAARTQRLSQVVVDVAVASIGEAHLPELLLERHARQQRRRARVDALVHSRFFVQNAAHGRLAECGRATGP